MMNSRPVGGRSSEIYSHPIDMNNKAARILDISNDVVS
jgi:hypothetical protein